MEKKYVFIHYKWGILKIFKRIKKMVIHRKLSGYYLAINNKHIGFFMDDDSKPKFKKPDYEHSIRNRKK